MAAHPLAAAPRALRAVRDEELGACVFLRKGVIVIGPLRGELLATPRAIEVPGPNRRNQWRFSGGRSVFLWRSCLPTPSDVLACAAVHCVRIPTENPCDA